MQILWTRYEGDMAGWTKQIEAPIAPIPLSDILLPTGTDDRPDLAVEEAYMLMWCLVPDPPPRYRVLIDIWEP